MLISGSSLKGLAVEAKDGKIGVVSDVLFDDRTWKSRWMVVDTSHWLTGRKVLVHPSAMAQPDFARMEIAVHLTKQQVKDSPDVQRDEPVSRQMQESLYGYYGTDPLWGGGNYFGGAMGGMGWPLGATRSHAGGDLLYADQAPLEDEGDPHLRSLTAVTGYHLEAADGPIGHIENFMMDTQTWGIRYMAVDTRNWWPGQHVLVSPYAVKSINWLDREVVVDITQAQVKASPPWSPADLVERAYEERLHGYYNWPGYGW